LVNLDLINKRRYTT